MSFWLSKDVILTFGSLNDVVEVLVGVPSDEGIVNELAGEGGPRNIVAAVEGVGRRREDELHLGELWEARIWRENELSGLKFEELSWLSGYEHGLSTVRSLVRICWQQQ